MEDMLVSIVLVRHAQSNGNLHGHVTGHKNDELTEAGTNRARQLSNKLAKFPPFAKAYSSDAKRSISTAYFAGVGDPIILSQLNETHGGVWSSRTRTEFDAAFPSFFANFDPNASYPGGESHEDMRRRVIEAFCGVILPNTASAIVFTHLGPINAILHYFLEIPMSKFPMFDCPHCGSVELKFRVGRSRPVLTRISLSFA